MPVEGEVRIENPQTVKLTGVFRLGSDVSHLLYPLYALAHSNRF